MRTQVERPGAVRGAAMQGTGVHRSGGTGPVLAPMAERANAGPHVAGLAALQRVVSPVAQRAVADDVAAMGVGAELQTMLRRSASARTLVQRADALGVQVRRGGAHAHTTRTQGGGQLRVLVPAAQAGMHAIESILFELQNAVRYDRIEALGTRAVSGDIADEDEFAREKIQIELEGMIGTGRIAFEHNVHSEVGPGQRIWGMYYPTFNDYRKRWTDDPSLTPQQYAASMADEVLDRPHALGSHRQVYGGQFRALANPGNQGARERNQRLKHQAGQVSAMGKVLGPGPAMKKLWNETEDGPEVAAWLEHHRDARAWAGVHGDTLPAVAESLAQALATGRGEEMIGRLGRGAAKTLYAWIERNDEGEYRNLAQVLGLFLGAYDGRPELLQHPIY